METHLSQEKLQTIWLIVQIIGYVFGTGIIGTAAGFCYKAYNRLTKTYKTLEYIEKELKPNGGSSVKDTINRIESKVNYITFAQHTFWDHQTNIPMFSTDTNGCTVWVNKAMCDLLDRQVAEFLGTAWETVVLQKEREAVRNEWYRAVSEERPFEMSYTLVHSKGKEISVRCKAFGSSKTGYVGFIALV